MGNSYLTGHGTRVTPQSEAIPGSGQVANNAGGYAWELDDFARLRRFLVLGTEGGTYYVGQRQLTLDNADVVRRCLTQDGARTITTIVDVSRAGRAPKNDPALYALAIVASEGDETIRKVAFDVLPQVARTGTHLFQFVGFLEEFRGWGRAARKAIAKWYDRDDLGYQLVKYRQRGGWTHRDVLRLAHPKPVSDEQDRLFAWAVKPEGATLVENKSVLAFEAAQAAKSSKETAKLVRTYGSSLPREALKPELIDRDVWAALLEVGMPMTALIRNLATMTRLDVFDDRESLRIALDQLDNEERIRRARVHPIAVLTALRTYDAGVGFRGSNTWTPVAAITDALDAAFYKAFGNVTPTGKRTLLALDVSGSMTWGNVAGSPLTPREASAAMALVTAATERAGDYEIVGFTTTLKQLNISPRQRIADAVKVVSNLRFGGTNCAAPMLWATERAREFDTFVVYTDNETWAGHTHPAQALKEYRRRSGVGDAKLIVVGMTATGFSIADPNDPGMLDVVGFDTATPELLSAFSRGDV